MKSGEAGGGVQKLDPIIRESGDRVFTIECIAKHPVGWTKMSRRPAGEDLSPFLESTMAKQLQVPKEWWRELVACDHNRAEYLTVTGHADCKAPPPAPTQQVKRVRRPRRKRR